MLQVFSDVFANHKRVNQFWEWRGSKQIEENQKARLQ